MPNNCQHKNTHRVCDDCETVLDNLGGLSDMRLGELLAHRSPHVRRHATGCYKAIQDGMTDKEVMSSYYRRTPHLFQPSPDTFLCDGCHDDNIVCLACGICATCHPDPTKS